MRNLIFVFTFCFSIFVNAQNASEVTNATVFNGAMDTYANYIKNGVGTGNLTMGIGTLNASITKGTASTDKLDGLTTFKCDTSAQYGYCQWGTNTIQEGDKTGNCMAQATYKGDGTLYQLQLLHSSSTVAVAQLRNQTDWGQAAIYFPCTSSVPQVKLVQMTAGTSPAVSIGRIKYGKTRFPEVSQPMFYGGAQQDGGANCIYGESTSTSETNYVDLGTAASCASSWQSYGGVTTNGTASHQITLPNMPPGDYMVTMAAPFYSPGSGLFCNYKFSDGTNTFGYNTIFSSGVGGVSAGQMTGRITYTTAGTRTWKVQASDSTTGTCSIANSEAGRSVIWRIHRFPSTSEIVTRSSLPVLPTIQKFTSGTSQTYTTPIGVSHIRVRMVGGGGGGSGGSNAGATIGNAGSAGGNTVFGTSLLQANGGAGGGAGDGSSYGGAGGAPTITSPAVGSGFVGGRGGTSQRGGTTPIYIAGGIGGANALGGAGAGGSVNGNGQAGEANTGAGGGGGGPSAGTPGNAGPGGGAGAYIEALILNPSATYTYSVGAGGALGNANGGGGNGATGGNGYIEVTEYYQKETTPVFVGSITSSTTGYMRNEVVKFTTNAGTCVIDYQSGDWITGTTHNANGDCSLAIRANYFSAPPVCTCTTQQGASGVVCLLNDAPTVSALRFAARITATASNNSLTPTAIYVSCMGPR